MTISSATSPSGVSLKLTMQPQSRHSKTKHLVPSPSVLLRRAFELVAAKLDAELYPPILIRHLALGPFKARASVSQHGFRSWAHVPAGIAHETWSFPRQSTADIQVNSPKCEDTLC